MGRAEIYDAEGDLGAWRDCREEEEEVQEKGDDKDEDE